MKAIPGKPISRVRRWGEKGATMRIVLLHGFMAGANSWAPIAEKLAEQGWRVYAPCIAPASEAEASFDALSAALDTVVRECAAEGEIKPVLYGYSMGGRLALEYLQRYPEAPVGSLVLESASFGPHDAAEAEELRQRSRQWAKRFSSESPAEYVAWWESLGLFATQADLPAEVRARQRRARKAVPAETLAALTLAAGQGEMHSAQENRAMLGRLRLPYWYFTGMLDFKYAAVARWLGEDGVELVPGAGHNVHLEKPDFVVEAFAEMHEQALEALPEVREEAAQLTAAYARLEELAEAGIRGEELSEMQMTEMMTLIGLLAEEVPEVALLLGETE